MLVYVLNTGCLEIDKKNAGSILGKVDVKEFELSVDFFLP